MTPLMTAKAVAYKLDDDPYHITIDEEKVKQLAKKIKTEWKPEINDWSLPQFENRGIDPEIANCQIILYELIANSVNYKYWYGKQNIRPNNSSSTQMYKLLDEAFALVVHPGHSFTDAYCETVINVFRNSLIMNRLPMISERIQHLRELDSKKVGDFVRCMSAKLTQKIATDLDEWMGHLITTFPGYGNDIFLKRAILFFMMLYRRKGWFGNDLKKMIIPADYHIPNVLRYFGCVDYDIQTRQDIQEGVLIPEGSLLECEIRAAAIVIADMMIEEDVNPVQLDDYLWANKKNATTPFHLTITTNY